MSVHDSTYVYHRGTRVRGFPSVRFREVAPGAKIVRRDPRFSDVSGALNDT